jgi:hypothetical protein
MLVAMTITLILGFILAQVAMQASNVYEQGESQNDYNVRARTALSQMARELRLATLGVDPTRSDFQVLLSSPSLPVSDITYNYPNSLFWIAPLASDTSMGDMAELGYFIQWSGNQPNLCRLFINEGTNGAPDPNFIYAQASAGAGKWINQSILAAEAPATKPSYQGLFLENVVGLWIQLYASSGDPIPLYPNLQPPFSIPAYTNLPDSAEISMAFLDPSGAARLANSSSAAATLKSLVVSSANSSLSASQQAQNFVTSLNTHPELKFLSTGVRTAGIKVNFDNSRNQNFNYNAGP